MAGFFKNRKSSSPKRASAARRSKVPGTNYYKTKSGRYQNAKGKFVKTSSVKRVTSRKRKSTALSGTKRKLRRNKPSIGYTSAYSKGWERSERAKKAAATRKRRQASAARQRGKKSSIGRYSRVRVEDPKTGRQRLSYMYTTPKGRRRRIPAKALVKTRHMTLSDIKRGRAKAARRIKKEGSAFVANKRKKSSGRPTSARRRRAGKRAAAYMAAKRSGATNASAKRAAIRKVPLARGDSFKKTTRLGKLPARARISKKGPHRFVKNKKKKAVASTEMAANRRRRRRKKSTTPNRRRKTTRRRLTANKRRRPASRRRLTARRRRVRANNMTTNRRRVARRKSLSPNRRRKTSMRKNRRTTYRRNQGWMTTFQRALMTGVSVFGGYLFHKVATNLVCDPIFDLFKPKEAATSGVGQVAALETWKKPICGFGVLAVGLPLAGMVFQKNQKRALEVGAGMVTSWLQSILVSVSVVSNQPNFVRAVGETPDRFDWTGRKWPYTDSRAYSLHGRRRRRRGVRGLGNSQHLRSIMPEYVPVQGQMGKSWMQAAAGQYQQAAAGQYQQAAAGEYFTPNATGEYFAPSSTQGVGAYEAAGQLAMPGNNQVIEDGVRPDSNLDHEMNVMEAAAGLRGGVGSYFESRNGQIERVGTQSQWIPNGPLFAGEMQVSAGQDASMLSAGVLNRPGGNGILSGG